MRTGTSPYSISYTPDLVGNRVSETNGAATTALNYDNDDELTSTTSSTGGFVNSYSYNLNGEQTGRTLSGTAYTLAYDYDGQLVSISTGGSTVSNFAYDALGRRVSRTNGGTTTSFLFDGGSVVAQNAGGTYQMPTTFGNQPIRSGSELPIYDVQGNQRAATASNQTVTATQIFDAFGNQVAATGSTASALQWQGTSLYRTYAPDAGLLQAGARYYDAQVGRFTTRDTVLSQPAYIYCGGDPINCGDPSGRDITPRLRHWIYSGLGIIATIGLGAAGVGSTLTSPAWVPITIGVCTVLAVISLIGLSAEGDPGGPWFPPAPNVPNGPPDPNDPYGGHSPGTGHRQTGGGVNYD